jgi:hypothetical protein
LVAKGRRDRLSTFFTFNAEFFRERRSAQGFAIYPSAKMRAGDLTEAYFRRADGSLIPIMDLGSGQPFPGNQIPASRIVPQASGFFKFWPQPNFGPAEFNGTNNYTGTQRDLTNDDQEFVRAGADRNTVRARQKRHALGGKRERAGEFTVPLKQPPLKVLLDPTASVLRR